MPDLIFALILGVSILWGMKKGFVKTIMGFISLILSIYLGVVMYNPFVELMFKIPVMNDILTGIKTSIASTVRPVIEGTVEGGLPQYISMLVSPEMIAQGSEAVAAGVAETVFSLTLIIIFILVVKIGISMIAGVLNIAAKLPVIKQLNKLLGAGMGLICGIIFCYIAAAVLSVIAAYGGGEWIYKSMETSFIAKYFIDSNIIINMILK